MKLDYVPLLQTMRALHDIPRGEPPHFNGLKRFRHYLRTIFPGDGEQPQLLPLLVMNPMGKDHVAEMLEELLAFDAEAIGARAAADAADSASDVPGKFKVGLVVADDRMGLGTNRCDYEFTLRFGDNRARARCEPREQPAWLKDLWIMGVLWTSEPATCEAVRTSIATAVRRMAYVHRHGSARTLGAMLAQEGAVIDAAGCTWPALDRDDIEYTRSVLAPHLESSDRRVCMECLFGDAPCCSLGFTPRGLSPWAGLALALYDAQHQAAASGVMVPRRGGGTGRRSPKKMTGRGRQGEWIARSND